jgi:DNA polymerase III subunit epsilon
VYLFFDTETSGLPRDWQAPPSIGPNWPRLVTIAWLVVDVDGRELRSHHVLIRPVGWDKIDPGAQAAHGISIEKARAEGVSIGPELEWFRREVDAAQAVLAHNYNFDSRVVASEFLRQGRVDPFVGKAQLCTMIASTPIANIPPTAKMIAAGRNHPKSPSLAELHRFLFGDDPIDQHDAMGDTRTCKKCFFELRRRDLLPSIGDSSVSVAAKGGAA